MVNSKSSLLSDYQKSVIISKTINKRKVRCLKNHECGLTQNPQNPKHRICLSCQKLRNKSKWIKKKSEIEKLENKKFKFFGI